MKQVEIEIDLPTYKLWEKAVYGSLADAINTVAAMPAYEKKQA